MFQKIIQFSLLTLGMIFVLFLGINKVSAQIIPSQEVVINELMWSGSSKSTSDEWIELYNTTDETIDLSGWKINNIIIPTGKFIHSKDHFLISHYDIGSTNTILNIKPDLVYPSITISNSSLQLQLNDSFGNIIDIAGDGETPLAGINTNPKASMERNEIPGDGTQKINWRSTTTSLNLISGATEFATPQNSNNQPPSIPNLLLPDDDITNTYGTNIKFTWSKAIDLENDFIYYILLLSCSNTFDQNLITISDLGDDYFNIKSNEIVDDIGVCPVYYWAVKASDGELDSVLSPLRKIQISEPAYSDDIIINEILPQPEDGTDNEFIELYNKDSIEVDLSGWFIDDIDGGSTPFEIPVGTKILAGGYLVFYKSQTGIALNDSGGDSARLLNPKKDVANQIIYSENAPLGLSWARGPDDNWSWTTTVTSKAENIIISPTNDLSNIDPDIPINTTPIEVKTGEVLNYNNYLIQITGTVTKTSGNTFYLDDGSGIIKVYIQDKTGIEKSTMHTGDTFTVVGIVDLYGNTWRVLPQKQDDVKLVKCIKGVTVKKTTKKVASATKSTTADKISKASNIISTAKAVSGESTNKNEKTPFWLQIIELIVGLGIIGLVILVIKISRRPKDPIIGGHFGDDLT